MEYNNSTHPGQILYKHFLEPNKLSSTRLAIQLKVDLHTITDLVRGRRGLTAETALRLARFFETTPEYWLEMQMHYDLKKAQEKCLDRFEKEITPYRDSFFFFKPPEEASVHKRVKSADAKENADAQGNADAQKRKVAQKKDFESKLEKVKEWVPAGFSDALKVLEVIGAEPISYDALFRDFHMQMTSSSLNVSLMILKMEGLIKEPFTQMYVKSKDFLDIIYES